MRETCFVCKSINSVIQYQLIHINFFISLFHSKIKKPIQITKLFTGIGGSGRQSATKLSAFMADYDLFVIEITKNYTVNEWREDIKKVNFDL